MNTQGCEWLAQHKSHGHFRSPSLSRILIDRKKANVDLGSYACLDTQDDSVSGGDLQLSTVV